MALTEAQARDDYNLIKRALVTILKAESTVQAVMGDSSKARGEKTIEARLRNEPRDFVDEELPSLTVVVTSGTDANNEAEGRLHEIEKTYNVTIFVLARGGDLGEVEDRCNQVASVVEMFLRRQVRRSSELDAELADPDPVDVNLTNVSTIFTPTGAGQSRFEVVGTMTFQVVVDICLDLP